MGRRRRSGGAVLGDIGDIGDVGDDGDIRDNGDVGDGNVVPGDEDIVLGDGNVVPGDVVLFPSATRVYVTARDGANPSVRGCGFPDGQVWSARGARNGEASGDDGAAGTLRVGIEGGDRCVSADAQLKRCVWTVRARGRDAGTRPARGVVDTETGGDRRGMPQGRARARETGRALAIGAVVRVNGGAERTWKTRLRGRGE